MVPDSRFHFDVFRCHHALQHLPTVVDYQIICILLRIYLEHPDFH
jgi:hypothetical protein